MFNKTKNLTLVHSQPYIGWEREKLCILRVKSARDIWTANGVFPLSFQCCYSSVSSRISRHRLLPLKSLCRMKEKERQRAGFTGLKKRDVIIPTTPWSTAAKLFHHECCTNGCSCRNRNENNCNEKTGPLRQWTCFLWFYQVTETLLATSFIASSEMHWEMYGFSICWIKKKKNLIWYLAVLYSECVSSNFMTGKLV